MKLIPLTKGYSAMVDDADFEWLSQWKWYAKVCEHTVYCARSISGGKTVRMHRQILGLKNSKVFGEHADGNGLNNQRINLRLCTSAESMMNRFSNKNTSSKYKGVHWKGNAGKWVSQIMVNNKKVSIGYFASEIEAARAYNQKRKIYLGNQPY